MKWFMPPLGMRLVEVKVEDHICPICKAKTESEEHVISNVPIDILREEPCCSENN